MRIPEEAVWIKLRNHPKRTYHQNTRWMGQEDQALPETRQALPNLKIREDLLYNIPSDFKRSASRFGLEDSSSAKRVETSLESE
jgi:hypothetical protein